MFFRRNSFSRRLTSVLIPCLLLAWLLPPAAPAMTIKEERELGEKVLQEVKKRWSLVADPGVNEYVTKIGRRILEPLGSQPFEYQFYVLNTPEINAFAVPGGKVFFNSGLILLMENEGELAGVMAHEIGHIVARHISKRSEKGQAISLATLGAILAGIFLGGKAAGALATTSMAAGETAFLKYSREDEEEADYLGLRFMDRAGFERQSMISMLKKLRRVSGPASSDPPAYLLTHPAVEERAAELEIQMSRTPESEKKSPAVGDLQRVQTKLVVEEKDASRAVAYFENGVKRKGDAESYFGLALAQRRLGALDRAIENLEKAASLTPRDGEVFRELGAAYFLKANIPQARKNLEAASSLSPGDAQTYFYLGRIYSEQKMNDEALQAFLRARDLNPRLPELQYSLGLAYGAKGLLGEAYRCFGYHYKSVGDSKTALAHFEKALPHFRDASPERQTIQKEIEDLTPKKKDIRGPRDKERGALGR